VLALKESLVNLTRAASTCVEEMEAAKGENSALWTCMAISTSMTILVWFMRWAWAIAAAVWLRIPRRDPIDR